MIIDIHTHIFPPRFQERRQELLKRDATFGALYAQPRARMVTAEELVQAMDETEVDLSVTVGLGWTDPTLAEEANEYLLEASQRFRGRLVAFCGLNPRWGEAALSEAERLAQAGARGIGELHPDTQGFDLGDHDLMAPLMGLAQRLGLLVLTHTSEPVGHQYPGKGRTTPDVFLRLIQAFPGVMTIGAHWGGGLPFYALMPEVAVALANVYFDSAASPLLYEPRVFQTMVSLVGAEHLLFGTDFPLVNQREILAQVQQSDMPAEVKAQVLGGNAARLLRL